MDIMEILGEDYIKKFRVFLPVTLFEPTWANLAEGMCPYCGCKLIEARTRPIVFCKSVKHKKRFILSKEKYDEIKQKHGCASV